MTNKNPNEIEIEVFKTGTITDSEGNTKEWTIKDLQTIVNTYNQRIKGDPGTEAPIVKGHPETDEPAYGWVKSLKFKENKIIAQVSLVPEFAEQVKQELYKKVSIALYEDLMLRHIGFLGAVQPAVKGLEPVKFNRNDNYKTIEYNEMQNQYTKFSIITPKPKLKRQKPEIYTGYNEDDFADPVHYRFPLKTPSNIRASLAIFSRKEVRSLYNESEQNWIIARIVKSALNHGININPNKWNFTQYIEIPAEELSKSQLVNYINNKLKQQNSYVKQTTIGVTNMNEWLTAFIEAMTQKLSENINEEVATQFQAWADEYILAYPLPEEQKTTEEPTTEEDPATTTTASEPQYPKEFAERMERLEKENRTMKFSQYVESQISNGKLMPAQKELIINTLEYAYKIKDSYEFSENGKKNIINNGVDMVQKIVDSFPKHIEFNEFATKEKADKKLNHTIKLPDNAIIDPESSELDKKVQAFIEEAKKNNQIYTYTQALQHVLTNE